MPFRSSHQTLIPFRRARRFRNTRRRRRNHNTGLTRGRTFWNPTVPPHRGQPNTMLVKWRFAIAGGDINVINSSTGALVDYTYRANSCYDPYQGAGGAQPKTFDQWMALYRHGVVLGSKISAKFFFPTGATSEAPMGCYIVLKDATSAPGISDTVEGRSCVRKILTAGQQALHLNKTFSYKLISKNPMDEDDLMFSSTGSATQQFYYHVGGGALNGGTETAWFTGYIDYIVLLMHPIDPAQS